MLFRDCTVKTTSGRFLFLLFIVFIGFNWTILNVELAEGVLYIILRERF